MREAFKKWIKDTFYRAPIDSETLREAFSAGWQAAQAQAGAGEAIYIRIYDSAENGWCGAETESGKTVLVGEKSDGCYLLYGPLYTAPPAAVNQQLLEALHKVRDLLNGWQSDLAIVSMSIDVIDAAIAAAQGQR